MCWLTAICWFSNPFPALACGDRERVSREAPPHTAPGIGGRGIEGAGLPTPRLGFDRDGSGKASPVAKSCAARGIVGPPLKRCAFCAMGPSG
jgi:hypothetical protein